MMVWHDSTTLGVVRPRGYRKDRQSWRQQLKRLRCIPSSSGACLCRTPPQQSSICVTSSTKSTRLVSAVSMHPNPNRNVRRRNKVDTCTFEIRSIRLGICFQQVFTHDDTNFTWTNEKTTLPIATKCETCLLLLKTSSACFPSVVVDFLIILGFLITALSLINIYLGIKNHPKQFITTPPPKFWLKVEVYKVEVVAFVMLGILNDVEVLAQCTQGEATSILCTNIRTKESAQSHGTFSQCAALGVSTLVRKQGVAATKQTTPTSLPFLHVSWKWQELLHWHVWFDYLEFFASLSRDGGMEETLMHTRRKCQEKLEGT